MGIIPNGRQTLHQDDQQTRTTHCIQCARPNIDNHHQIFTPTPQPHSTIHDQGHNKYEKMNGSRENRQKNAIIQATTRN